ncbi:GIY-YIG nuclease family protein [Salinibacter ruber]|uniref:GIY-YIG nuclease family protein n=1 Tax=Salinibacter ruber TaxID=146919 RepID=UPI000E586FCE|nr:GIY-YIG nuclease family protein [Salinibacter ruber]
MKRFGDAKRFVCEKCSTEKVKGSDFTGTRCPKCGRKMDLKSYTTERPEMEKPKTEKSEADEEEGERRETNAAPSEEPKRDREDVDSDSWWGKEFVCKRCSVEKVTRTDVIDTSCPECGEEMTFWRAVKGKKDPDRDIHSKDQSTEDHSTKDQSDGKEWWGEGRWWARWWALPLGLFLFEYALAVQLGVIDPGLGRIPQTQALLYVSLSAPVCVMYAWMLAKELENPLRERQEKPVQWGIALFILLIPVVLGVMYGMSASRGPVVENSVLAGTAIFEAIVSGFYFLWLTLLRFESLLEFDERSGSSWKRTPARSSSGRKRKFRGYVYVATNPNIKGLVKIGYTERTVEKRMKELSSSTGVPGRYKAKYKFKAVRPKQLERKVHRRLSSRRVERGGEFFKVSPKKAARVIKKVAA